MRNLIFGINMTADGFCSHTDGIADEELHGYFTELLRTTDGILYGRVTYDLMVPFWPDIARNQSMPPKLNEFAQVFDALEKIVFSRTMKEAGSNTRIVREDLEGTVAALKQKPGKPICVGSLSIASQLSRAGLIDEYRFVVHPMIAGKGPRLFDTVKQDQTLRLDLVETRRFAAGRVALHYRKQK